MVHGLDHERKAVGPVIAAPGNQPDADGISPRHKAIAVVLNLMNPVGAGRRTVGGGRQARLDETQNGRHSGGKYRPCPARNRISAAAGVPLAGGVHLVRCKSP